MNPADDSRFLHLAMKAVAAKCAPEEQVELESLLRANAGLAQQYAELTKEHALAAKLIPLVAAAVAPPMAVPASIQQRVRTAIASRKKAAVAEPAEVKPRVLSAKELEILVLKVLSERPMDGFELAGSLRKAKVANLEGGEGTVYGLLARLESAGCLQGRWRPDGGRMAKTYHVTEKGTTSLRGSRALMGNLEEVARSILAVDGAGT